MKNDYSPSNLDFASLIQPSSPTGRFSDPDYFIWCGSVVEDDSGKWHLFYARWLRCFGFQAWVTHSEIARAVADSPCGPFRHEAVVLPARGAEFWDGLCTHNPTIHRFDGRYYLYYTGNTGDGVPTSGLNWTHRNNQRVGVAAATRPEGPWERFAQPLIDTTPGLADALCCNNPSITRSFDGSYLMVYKAIGDQGELPFGGPVVHLVATSASPTGPFVKHPQPVFLKAGVSFAAEDPFIWTQDGCYWAIVKDMGGHFTHAGRSLALFTSKDGFDWQLAAHPLVARTEIRWADGTLETLEALERPQLAFRSGVPIALLCAAQMRDGDTFNVQIPLRTSR